MYYHNMQNSVTDCGIAVLKTVLQQFGRRLTKDFVKEISLDEGQGMSLKDLENVLEIQGIHASSYELIDFGELKNVLLPSIAIVEQNGKNHYIVIHGFNDINKEIMISDPAKVEIEKISLDKFKKIFSGYILCVESVEEKKTEESKRSLYSDIIGTIALSFKIKYSFLSIIKWGMPIGLLFIIQFLFMFYIEKMNLLNIVLVVMLFSFLSVGYYYLSLAYQSYKITLEKRISSKMTMKYLMSEIEIVSNKKNANDTEGVFWNIVVSVLGILQKFYLKIDLILILLFIGIIGILNWVYALIIIVFIIAISLYSYGFKNKIKNRQVELIGASSEMSACIQEMTQSSLDLKIFSDMETVEKYCNDTYDKYEKVRENIGQEDMKMLAFYDMCSYIALAFGVGVVFISYIKGSYFSSSSMIIAFYMTIFMIMNFKSTFQRWIEYQKSVNAIEYIELMFEPKSEREEVNKLLLEQIKEMELEKIDVRIAGRQILNNLNFKVSQGCIVGIKGENGSGKTTLAKTILGLINPDKGIIKINGTKIGESLLNTDITKYISFYSTELYTYSDSVKNNISFNIFQKENLNSTYSYMNELDLEYLLFLNGINISQGERQKILLDRCFEKEKSVYIFDEPGTNLDKESQKKLLEMFNALKEREKIILVISHEEEILSCCDECYQMKNGNLHKLEVNG